ncbi:YrdB family protein [Dactylosporangium cerinum]|uniref:YrdB family protein n=1 Tax=Dactylosporangium cerinum TaxID=1434730 RepID=A0ABV9WDU8_9ACTN
MTANTAPTSEQGPQGSGPNRGVFTANELLAFILELVALACLGYWGLEIGDTVLIKGALAIGAPLLAAALWGMFAAPRARYKVSLAGQLAVKALVFGAAAVALFATGQPALGAVFIMVVVPNTIAATIWRGRAASRGKAGPP